VREERNDGITSSFVERLDGARSSADVSGKAQRVSFPLRTEVEARALRITRRTRAIKRCGAVIPDRGRRPRLFRGPISEMAGMSSEGAGAVRGRNRGRISWHIAISKAVHAPLYQMGRYGGRGVLSFLASSAHRCEKTQFVFGRRATGGSIRC